jgi:hypothetical protein
VTVNPKNMVARLAILKVNQIAYPSGWCSTHNESNYQCCRQVCWTPTGVVVEHDRKKQFLDVDCERDNNEFTPQKYFLSFFALLEQQRLQTLRCQFISHCWDVVPIIPCVAGNSFKATLRILIIVRAFTIAGIDETCSMKNIIYDVGVAKNSVTLNDLPTRKLKAKGIQT